MQCVEQTVPGAGSRPLQDAGDGSSGTPGDTAGVQSDPQGDRHRGGRSWKTAASVGLHVGLPDGSVVVDVAGDRGVPQRTRALASGVGTNRRQ